MFHILKLFHIYEKISTFSIRYFVEDVAIIMSRCMHYIKYFIKIFLKLEIEY